MQTINLELPEFISEFYKQNIRIIKEKIKREFVIWEYLNGRLTLAECGDIFKTGYQGFLELLWSKGIPIYAFNKEELEAQIAHPAYL